MKKIFVLILLVLLIPSVLAINLEIEKESSNEVLIEGLNMPAVFDLRITNWGASDNFQFYNLVGFRIEPNIVSIAQGETKEAQLRISPIGEIKNKGFYTFKYTIRGQDESEVDKQLTMQIIDLKNAFEIGADEFDSSTGSLNVFIHNKVNFDFNKINVNFVSQFFNFEEEFSLGPNEKKSFEVQLNKENFKKLIAGFYTFKAEVIAEEEKADVEGTLKFVEKNLVTSTEDNYGIIVNTKTIEKINEGNVVIKSETIVKKNIISRLVTSFNIAPDTVERDGFFVYYTWAREVMPGESLKIVAKTNWLFPLLIIFFIIAIVFFTKQYSKTNLSLRKKVSFVKAKGGEFALKTSIIIDAKKYVENIKVIDQIPPLVKIHKRFGGDLPKRIYERTRKVEWEFEKLEAGEHRVISYIIYSKIGILGRIALPTATAIYEKDGKVHETQSNRAFFLTEQGKKVIED